MARKPIGLHINSGRADAAAAEYIRGARPTVMKWLTDGMGDGSLIRLAKQYGALTVGRVYVERQDLDEHSQAAMLARVKEAALRWPDIDAWEGFNESHQKGPDVSARAVFDIRLMEAMAAIGKRAVIGSFSVGQPEMAAWADYLPALRMALAGGHYVGLHEYGGPAMQWGAGANQVGMLEGGRWVHIDQATGPGVEGWFCLRYRKAVAEWRRLGLAGVPRILITESGLDDIQPRPDVGQRSGFLSYQGTEWETIRGLGDFADGLKWQCERWAEDPYIVGGVVFCWGDASGDWGLFDLADAPGVTRRIVDNMAALPDVGKDKDKGDTVAAELWPALAAAMPGRAIDLRGKLPENAGGPNGGFSVRPLSGLDTLAVHHTAGPKAQTAEQIARFHIDTRQYAGIGYHVLIRKGVAYYVGDVSQARACCKAQNHKVVCVCVTGDYETAPAAGGDLLAADDLEALQAVTGAIQAWAVARLGRRLAIKGHRQVEGQATACPGHRIMAVLPSLGGQAPAPAPRPADPADGAIRAASVAGHAAAGVRLNSTAALQRAIRADGFTPTTNEGRLVAGGVTYAWQRGEPLAGGAAWVYFCPVGEWGKVKRIPE